jgi:hypothetical protein
MENIIKNNILIAEFMGYQIIPYNGSKDKLIYNGNKYAKTVWKLKEMWGGLDLQYTGRFVECVKFPFDTDFNYLLPIIRMIEEQGYVVCIAGIRYQIYKVFEEDKPIISLVCGDLSKKTEMVYRLLISFIENFNKG